MASTTAVICQPYVAGPRGCLKAGTAITCRSPEEALRRAEHAYQVGSIFGAKIVQVMHDAEGDEFGEATSTVATTGSARMLSWPGYAGPRTHVSKGDILTAG